MEDAGWDQKQQVSTASRGQPATAGQQVSGGCGRESVVASDQGCFDVLVEVSVLGFPRPVPLPVWVLMSASGS
jgi:hypothetical protein